MKFPTPTITEILLKYPEATRIAQNQFPDTSTLMLTKRIFQNKDSVTVLSVFEIGFDEVKSGFIVTYELIFLMKTVNRSFVVKQTRKMFTNTTDMYKHPLSFLSEIISVDEVYEVIHEEINIL